MTSLKNDRNATGRAVALIGMAGVGKSTVGQALAARMALPFVDTDAVITEAQGRSLRTIIKSEGLAAFRAIEQRVVCGLEPASAIYSTGGSVVYSHAAMMHLRSFAKIVWLRNDAAIILGRIGDRAERGLASEPEKSLDTILTEREPLYARYADWVIDCGLRSAEAIAKEIFRELDK